MGSVYKTKYTLQKLYKLYISCTKGKEKLRQKKKNEQQQQNNAEINWNTEYKSEATSTVHS